MDLEAVKARGEEVLSRVLPTGNRLRLQLTIALIAATAFTAHARSVDVGFEAPDAACAGAPASIARVEDLFDAQANARDALVTIRRNAQDWKNLLLRGSNAADRQTMQQRFETQASLYEAQLLQLRGQLAPWATELERMELLERERVKLFERYRSALATYGVQTLEAAALADRAVQGADITTFRTLEQTVDALTTMTRMQIQTLKQTVARCVDSRSRQL